MNLLVVSDLHISDPDDPLYRSLLTLIQEKAETGDTVVLAGDLFDLFVGNKSIFVERYGEFFETLANACQRGVQLHYIEGNHDFLLTQAFRRVPGVSMHSHEVSLTMGSKKFFFAHGDTADSKDYSYRLMRALFRSPLMKVLVYLIPGKWLDKIGRMSSTHSRSAKPTLVTEFSSNKIEKIRTIYRSFAAEKLAEGYDFVVMGHCHDLDEMHFLIDGRKGQYVNVGYPRMHGSFLSWSPGEEKIQREKLP